MGTDKIRDLTALYEYVKEGRIPWVYPDKNEILHCEMKRFKQKKYYGNLVIFKKIITLFRPFRYFLACHQYQTIISFRPEKLRLAICEAAKKDILDHIEQYRLAYTLLDKPSQKIYINMLLYRLTGDYTFSILSQSPNEQYFSDRIPWENIKTVVDCGAFTGDTLQGFMRHKISVKNYYLYELDNDNYAKMLDVCKLAKNSGISVHPRKKGVFSRSTTLYFHADADSSMLVNYPTDNSIPVIALDEEIQEPVDFIKMDIEGSELDAINGAAEIIKKHKPLLAICIYHKQEDFWKIPLRIKEICPSYERFWVEQYSPWDIETVLFAEA